MALRHAGPDPDELRRQRLFGKLNENRENATGREPAKSITSLLHRGKWKALFIGLFSKEWC
jgi:hypothetical protein